MRSAGDHESVTRRTEPVQDGPTRRRRRGLLRWPATALPALLLVATAGLAGGAAGGSASSAPVVNITVTAQTAPVPAPPSP